MPLSPNSMRCFSGSARRAAAFVPILLVTSSPVTMCASNKTLHSNGPIFWAASCNGRKRLFSPVPKLIQSSQLHVVFDSYPGQSVKELERRRRSTNVAAIELASITEDTPIPKQLDKFWTSSSNKVKLQHFARQVAPKLDIPVDVVLSGMVLPDQCLEPLQV